MSTDHAYCPHCKQLLLADAPHPYPARPVRCSGCRLLVGPGRSRGEHGVRRQAPTPAATGRVDVVLDVLQDLRQTSASGDLPGAAAAPQGI
ncbi:hypothetical protein [Patulibacter americanus]|uniref:hypothetical protein n=1 Tax=Patulibacter americanus TaxID=588672 RepID=UPI0003B3B11D|nr:hypothetical protein [Patulibacter americanus]